MITDIEKLFSIMSNLQTHYDINLHFQKKVDQLAWLPICMGIIVSWTTGTYNIPQVSLNTLRLFYVFVVCNRSFLPM